MNLIDAITQCAFRHLAAPAFLSNRSVITYRKFYSLLCAVARAMHEQGVRPGDTVGLSMEQSPLHFVAVLALARLGAISIPVHPELAPSLRERIVARYSVRTMVSLNGAHGIAGVKSIRLDEVQAGTGGMDMGFTAYVPNGATPLRISLTSGTTGDPSGDMLTHRQLLYRVERTLYGCDCDCNSRVMPCDINSAMGLALAIGVLKVGGTLVFPNSYLSRDRMAAINLHAVTHAFLSPWATSQMLALPDNGIAFPVLRHLRLVGSAPGEALLDALRSRSTPHVFVTYGLTEIGPVSMATPEILAVRPRSSGEILPWVQLDVVDETGEVLPPGRSGEIRVKVAHGPTEHYADAQKTARKFGDGWFIAETTDGLPKKACCSSKAGWMK